MDRDRASTHNETAKSRINLGFDKWLGVSFNIRFLRESGGIFAHSREKNKVDADAAIVRIRHSGSKERQRLTRTTLYSKVSIEVAA